MASVVARCLSDPYPTDLFILVISVDTVIHFHKFPWPGRSGSLIIRLAILSGLG
jgi:hypothetical protein